MKRRTWFFIGAGFGFIIPLLLGVLQHFGPWDVHPSAYFLFRPGLFLLLPLQGVLHLFPSAQLEFLLLILGNSLVFGLIAYGLRRGVLAVIAALLVIIGISLPPSYAKLQAKFESEKFRFERLVQKGNETPSIVRISDSEFEDINGRKYNRVEKQELLSPESWREYREILKSIGMSEGVYRSAQTGQMEFMGHTLFGKIGPIGTLYGYVYCPASPEAYGIGFVPCIGQKQEWNKVAYRYRRISPEWYIYEVFERHSLND
jgi:hypothetical protein